MTFRDGKVPDGAAFVPQGPRAHVGALHQSWDSATGAVFDVTEWTGRVVRIYATELTFYLFHSTAAQQIDKAATLATAPAPNAGAPVTTGDADEIPAPIGAGEWVDVCVPSATGTHKSRATGQRVYLHTLADATTSAVRCHPSS